MAIDLKSFWRKMLDLDVVDAEALGELVEDVNPALRRGENWDYGMTSGWLDDGAEKHVFEQPSDLARAILDGEVCHA
jgi:hypothetical protein